VTPIRCCPGLGPWQRHLLLRLQDRIERLGGLVVRVEEVLIGRMNDDPANGIGPRIADDDLRCLVGEIVLSDLERTIRTRPVATVRCRNKSREQGNR
jgi:hypothetical protein